VLPPDFPGYAPYCPYTANPSADGAMVISPISVGRRRLVAESGHERHARHRHHDQRRRGAGDWASTWSHCWSGWDTERTLVTYPRINTTGVAFGDQLVYFIWELTMRAASNFLATLLSCGGHSDFAQFCSPSVDAAIRDALRLQTTIPAAANDLWGRIDRMVVDQAAWGAAGDRRTRPSSSAIVWATTRTRRQLQNALLDQVWVK